MKRKIFAMLAILISLAGIGATVVCLFLIPGIAVGPCTALIFFFLFFLVIGLYEELNMNREIKKQVAPHLFGPEPVNPDYEEQKMWDIKVLSFLGGGLIAVIFFYLIHKYAGLAALVLMFIGLMLISRRAARRKTEAAERMERRFRLYGGTTPIEFASYRFDDESLSRAAEILSASRVSEIPACISCYDKIYGLVQDGSCVVFSRGTGIDVILAGVRAVVARRELGAAGCAGTDVMGNRELGASVITKEAEMARREIAVPEITMEAVFARDTEQIRNRRRDGEDTDDNDLNVIGRLLEDAGFALLNLLYHPYGGHVITVVSTTEMGRLRELGYEDLKEMQKSR